MGRLSIHARRRIIHMKMNQPTLTRAQIAAALKFEDGVNVSVRTISNVWQRWTEHRTLADLPRSGRRSTIRVAHLNFIDQQINNDHEISSQELSRLFRQQFGMNISAPTIRRLRYKLQWRYTGTQYCQLIREVNKAKRLQYCVDAVTSAENFEDVIFTDECSVMIQKNVGKMFRKVTEPRVLVPKPKHPLKVSPLVCIDIPFPSRRMQHQGHILGSAFYIRYNIKLLLQRALAR